MRYLLIIPSSQLYIIREWDQDLSLQSFKGRGTSGTRTEEIPLAFGAVRQSVRNEVSLNYLMEKGETSLEHLFGTVRDWVPDVSFDRFNYIERECKMGDPDLSTINLIFERFTIPSNKIKNLVMDGDYPYKELHDLLAGIKSRLKDLPREITDRARPSVMILKETIPDVMNDGPCIFALKRDYMLFTTEKVKHWLMKDIEIKKRGGPRV